MAESYQIAIVNFYKEWIPRETIPGLNICLRTTKEGTQSII